MKKGLTLVIIFVLILAEAVSADPTRVIVRARAKDAKFVGTSIGGALVIIKNSTTGEILARGLTAGGTGNTDLLMKETHKRGEALTDEKTAKFEAIIDINQPEFVTVEVYSPINKKQATVKATTQLWLIPGKNITGDGIIVQIPGFIVDVLKPQTHSFLSRGESGGKIYIAANVVMMCGCPVTVGGIWNANNYDVEAIITRNGKTIGKVALNEKDKMNTFEAYYKVLENGVYLITVFAYDPATGNTGVDKTSVIVSD